MTKEEREKKKREQEAYEEKMNKYEQQSIERRKREEKSLYSQNENLFQTTIKDIICTYDKWRDQDKQYKIR